MTPSNKLLLDAAYECSSPDQVNVIEALIIGDADYSRRLINCINKRQTAPSAQQAAGSIDTMELRRLAEAAKDSGDWLSVDRTVYALEHHGWRKGEELFRNRFSFNVQRGPEFDDKACAMVAEFCAAANPAAILRLLNELDMVRSLYEGAHADRMALAAATPAQPIAPPNFAAVIEALRFYAEGQHFVLHDADVFDTVSGEPQNWQEDESNTIMFEDGSVAKLALDAYSVAQPIADVSAPTDERDLVDVATGVMCDWNMLDNYDEHETDKFCTALEKAFIAARAAAPSQPTDTTELADAIFAIRSTAPTYNNLHVISAYNDGHYDARCAAMELVKARAAAPVSVTLDSKPDGLWVDFKSTAGGARLSLNNAASERGPMTRRIMEEAIADYQEKQGGVK